MVLRHSLDIVVGQYSVAPIAILRHHRGSLETELHRSHKSFEPGSAPSTLSMHGITIKLPAQYGKFGRLQSLCGNCKIFVGRGFSRAVKYAG